MSKLTKKLSAGGKKAYLKLETEILAAAGRRAVRRKAQAIAQVGRKAAKAGLIVGAVVAAGVAVREIRKRRNPA